MVVLHHFAPITYLLESVRRVRLWVTSKAALQIMSFSRLRTDSKANCWRGPLYLCVFSMQSPEVIKSCCEMREGWYVMSKTASWRVLKPGAVPFCSKARAGRRSCYQFLAGDPSIFVAIITIFNRILHWDKFSSVLVCSFRKQEIIVQVYVLLMSLQVPSNAVSILLRTAPETSSRWYSLCRVASRHGLTLFNPPSLPKHGTEDLLL